MPAAPSAYCPRYGRDFGGISAFSGPVSTVQCFEDNSLVKAAVDSPGLGRVLVVDGGGSLRRALVGGNLAAAAARNGWAGLVVDGCVRDVAELAASAVGIRALAAMPLPTEKRGQGQRDSASANPGRVGTPGRLAVCRRRRHRRQQHGSALKHAQASHHEPPRWFFRTATAFRRAPTGCCWSNCARAVLTSAL